MLRFDVDPHVHLHHVWIKPDGTPHDIGYVLRNPELAAVLRRIAAEGPRALHEGRVAQAIVDKVEADALRVLRDSAFLQKLRGAGGDPYPGTQAEFRELIRKDQKRYSDLIRQAGVKAE